MRSRTDYLCDFFFIFPFLLTVKVLTFTVFFTRSLPTATKKASLVEREVAFAKQMTEGLYKGAFHCMKPK